MLPCDLVAPLRQIIWKSMRKQHSYIIEIQNIVALLKPFRTRGVIFEQTRDFNLACNVLKLSVIYIPLSHSLNIARSVE